MELVGFSVHRPTRRVSRLYMPLRRLSVLVGANDAGKSTLLTLLHDELARTATEVDGGEAGSGAFYFELTDSEIEMLVPGDQPRGRNPSKGDFEGLFWGPVGNPLGSGNARTAAEFAQSLDPPSGGPWDAQAVSLLVAELLKSRLVAFNFTRRGDGQVEWMPYWCVPPKAALPKAVVSALAGSGLAQFQGHAPRKHRRAFGQLFGDTAHLEAPGAPILVAPLAANQALGLPSPLRVPSSFREIANSATAALTKLVVAAQFGIDAARHDEPLDAGELKAQSWPDAWLTSGRASWAVQPIVLGGLELLLDEARAVLPDFVARHYELELEVIDVHDWATQGSIRFALRPRSETGFPWRFDIESVADGYRLWLQLALSSGVERVSRAAGLLERLAGEVAYDIDVAQGQDGEPDDDPSSAHSRFDRLLDRLAGVGNRGEGVANLRAELDALDVSVRGGSPSRLLLVDEPERHLHPGLGHAASRVLAAFARDTAPVVVASHSTAFLNGSDDDALNRIVRDSDGVQLVSLTKGASETLRVLAEDLGLERGELLTTVSCFLLVEGEHDRIVFEGLFGDRLRSAGVAIAPMRGVGGAGLFDSETLWRFSAAPAVMATDNIDRELVELTQSDPAEARRRLSALPNAELGGEERALLAALNAMDRHGRDLYFAAHSGTDLIDALDERAIASLHGKFTTHAAARDAYAARSKQGKLSRKAFYEQAYGIPAGNAAYPPLVEKHLELGIVPFELERIVNYAIERSKAYREGETPSAP